MKVLPSDYIVADRGTLSRTQLEAIRLLALGYSDYEISKKISTFGKRLRGPYVARTQIYIAKRNLNATTRAHLVGLAFAEGFLKAEDLREAMKEQEPA